MVSTTVKKHTTFARFPYTHKTFESPSTINAKSLAFKNIFYPEINIATRNDRSWQLKNTIHSFEKLKTMLPLKEEELKMFFEIPNTNFRITPYYLSLIDPEDVSDPLRKCMIPTFTETIRSP